MLITTDYIDPATLTGYVRAALADQAINQFSLAQFLPNDNIDDLEYRFLAGGEGLIEAATYRGFDTESPIGSTPGVTRVSGELPPISRKYRLGEYDRLRQRKATEQAVRDALLKTALRATRGISARLELARGDALVHGSVTIAENHVSATIDFGRQGNHTTAPGTLWSDTSGSDPIMDLIGWNQRFIDTNGEPPGAIVTSTRVVGLVQTNAKVRGLVATVAATPTIVSVETVNAILASHGLPALTTYDASVKVDGVATRVVPDDRVLMLPAPVAADAPEDTQLGATLWGTTAESLESEYDLAGDEPGVVAGVYSTSDPVALWTKGAAIGVPVMANPNLSLCADVA